MSTFESLPAELIQRIASLATAGSALSLSKCSRHLHEVCYDTVVFRRIIANKNGYSSEAIGAWDISFLPPTTPILDIVRCALADLRARTGVLPAENNEEYFIVPVSAKSNSDSSVSLKYNITEFVPWAAPLAFLGHPFCTTFDLVPFLQIVVDRVLEFSWMGFEINHVILAKLFSILQSPTISLTIEDLYKAEELLNRLDDLWGVGDECIIRTILMKYIKIRLSYPSSIPIRTSMLEFVPLSILGENALRLIWARYHEKGPIAQLLAAKASVEGEYTGYYHSEAFSNARTNCLIESVKLYIENAPNNVSTNAGTEQGCDCSLKRNVWGYGRDKTGPFELKGYLQHRIWLKLDKTPSDANDDSWRLKITPWGLITPCYPWQTDEYSSTIWLWKKGKNEMA